jgi:PII-like signaling protein
MRTVIGIGFAGAAGALARYGVDGVVSSRTSGAFPWGTFVVNITGAFVVGLAGATVLRGIEGFGADSHLHTSRILRLAEDLPVVIEIVDTAENVDRTLPALNEMVSEGMLTAEKVHVIAYRGSATTP